MSLITGQDVTLSYGDHVVLGGVGFALERDDRVGLVGRNGEGKTTLLRIMAGELRPTSGTVQRRRGLRVGHLPQTPPAEGDKTLWQACLDVFAELARMHERMEALAGQLADSAEAEDLKRFGVLQQAFETAGGYSYELRIRAVLTGLGFAPEQYGMPLGHLSGGQRARAMLARLLLEEPDVLLLDEPTSGLDDAATQRVVDIIARLPQAMVVVSHDRALLEKVTTRCVRLVEGRLEPVDPGAPKTV